MHTGRKKHAVIEVGISFIVIITVRLKKISSETYIKLFILAYSKRSSIYCYKIFFVLNECQSLSFFFVFAQCYNHIERKIKNSERTG